MTPSTADLDDSQRDLEREAGITTTYRLRQRVASLEAGVRKYLDGAFGIVEIVGWIVCVLVGVVALARWLLVS